MFYWQTIGTAPWNPEQVAGPADFPSIAQVGNSAAIAALDPNNNLMFYWQTIGTAPWNPEQVAESALPFPFTGSAPSLAQVGNSAAIAVQAFSPDAQGGPPETFVVKLYWQTIGTAPWNSEIVGFALSAPSLAQVGNSAAIAVLDVDGTLAVYWQTIGTAPWNEDGPEGSIATSAPSLAQVGNSAAIAAHGDNNSLMFYWQTIGSASPWNAEQVAGPDTTFFTPSVAQVG
jgi:hypothetical protein